MFEVGEDLLRARTPRRRSWSQGGRAGAPSPVPPRAVARRSAAAGSFLKNASQIPASRADHRSDRAGAARAAARLALAPGLAARRCDAPRRRSARSQWLITAPAIRVFSRSGPDSLATAAPARRSRPSSTIIVRFFGLRQGASRNVRLRFSSANSAFNPSSITSVFHRRGGGSLFASHVSSTALVASWNGASSRTTLCAPHREWYGLCAHVK